jgi:hypothetical protein
MDFILRQARLDERTKIEQLIAASARGYTGSESVAYTIGEGVSIQFVPMSKTIGRS